MTSDKHRGKVDFRGIFIMIVWGIIMVFILYPESEFLRQRQYQEFYELEGIFLMEKYQPTKIRSNISFENGETFYFQSIDKRDIKAVLTEGDTLVKNTKNAFFEIKKKRGTSYTFSYTPPLKDYTYWDLFSR